MIIIGAGEAGARAAVALREHGWTGAVTLIGREQYQPYERPPLSKAAMVREEEPSPTVTLDLARCLQHDISYVRSCSVSAIDRSAHDVICANGRRINYERLLIATGARPRRLEIPGGGDILYLRTFADALAVRSRLRSGARLAIIGAGFIGLEIAASAVERGCTVSIIENAPSILGRGVPKAIAEVMHARHLAAGVTFHFGATVAAIEHDAGLQALVLATGERIACDAVVAGVGAIPETTLAAASGLGVENGVKVDEYLCTDDPDIFAAGDCCSFPHVLYDRRRIRLEVSRNAQDQGAAAAANMLGISRPYDAVPSFWSEQYEQTLQIVGLPEVGATTLHRRVGDSATLHFHLASDGRLVAASGVGPTGRIAKDIRLSEMLIAKRVRPDPSDLVSPEVRLNSLLAAAKSLEGSQASFAVTENAAT